MLQSVMMIRRLLEKLSEMTNKKIQQMHSNSLMDSKYQKISWMFSMNASELLLKKDSDWVVKSLRHSMKWVKNLESQESESVSCRISHSKSSVALLKKKKIQSRGHGDGCDDQKKIYFQMMVKISNWKRVMKIQKQRDLPH